MSTSASDLGEAIDCIPHVMSEEEHVEWRRAEHHSLRRYRDRYWREVSPGFYEGAHRLARMSYDETGRPASACWGYHAALRDEDAHLANGSIPVHHLDLRTWSASSMDASKRRELRKVLPAFRFVALRGPSLLLDQGYGVYSSFATRVGVRSPQTLDYYLTYAERGTRDRRRLFIAALDGDRLLGYIQSHAVDGVAYLVEIVISSDALRSNVGTGLYFHTLEAYRRTGQVREAIVGLHAPEDADLCEYKRRIGFGIVQVPARVEVLPPISTWLRKNRPYAFYRLTGWIAPELLEPGRSAT